MRITPSPKKFRPPQISVAISAVAFLGLAMTHAAKSAGIIPQQMRVEPGRTFGMSVYIPAMGRYQPQMNNAEYIMVGFWRSCRNLTHVNVFSPAGDIWIGVLRS